MCHISSSLAVRCINGTFVGKLLPVNPWEAVAGGAVKDITFLHGVNKDEMNFFLVGMGGPEPFNEWASDRQAKPRSGRSTTGRTGR